MITGVLEEAIDKMETDDATPASSTEKKYLIDTNNIRMPRANMEIQSFMRESMGQC